MLEKIDHTAWCPPESRAGHYLAIELQKTGDQHLSRKVSSAIHKYNTHLKALNGLEKHERAFYMQLLLEKTRAGLPESFAGYPRICSLVDNLIVAVHRNTFNKFVKI